MILGFLRALARQTAGMIQITAVLCIPLVVSLIYLRLHVSVSSLQRQTRVAALRKEELIKRNRALKSTLSELAVAAGESPFRWQSYDRLPLSIEENKILDLSINLV